MDFPGPTEPDERSRQERLGNQYRAIFQLMQDGKARTLEEICYAVNHTYGVRCPPASASAQLRHMRKPEHGAHVILKEYVARGLYRYQLKTGRRQQELFR